MQNNYQGYSVFNPLPPRQPEPENLITNIKRKFESMNKNVLIGVLIVIAAGFVVGGFITIKNRNGGQVEGALTEASPTEDPGIGISTASPIPTDTPADTPTDVPTDQPLNTPTDNSAEGAAPTTVPTNTPSPTASPSPTPTPTPTASPTTYQAANISITPNNIPADGSTASVVTLTVEDGSGTPISGPTVTLGSNGCAIFNQNSVPAVDQNGTKGQATFNITSTTVGSCDIKVQIYTQPATDLGQITVTTTPSPAPTQ